MYEFRTIHWFRVRIRGRRVEYVVFQITNEQFQRVNLWFLLREMKKSEFMVDSSGVDKRARALTRDSVIVCHSVRIGKKETGIPAGVIVGRLDVF